MKLRLIYLAVLAIAISLVIAGCGEGDFDNASKTSDGASISNITDCKPVYTLKGISGTKIRVCRFTDPDGRSCLQSSSGGGSNQETASVSCDPPAADAAQSDSTSDTSTTDES